MKQKHNTINLEHPICDVDYETRKQIEKDYRKALLRRRGILYSCGVVIGVIIFAMVSDFVRQRKIWNMVETSSWVVVIITAVTCAMLLDIPMAYLGAELKKYSQKLIGKKELFRIACLSITPFLITFIFYFMFTVSTRNNAYSLKGNSVIRIGNIADEPQNANSSAILQIALYAGILPLGTSLLSLLAGYCSSSPLDDEIYLLTLKRIDKENNIMDVNQAIAEAEAPLEHFTHLTLKETEQYKSFLSTLDMEGLCLKIMAAELIANRINTPEAYSEMVIKSQRLVEQYKKSFDGSEEGFDYLKEEMMKYGSDEIFIDRALESPAVICQA